MTSARSRQSQLRALGHCDLPRIILASALSGAALAQGRVLGGLMADGLPADGAKNLPHGGRIRRVSELFRCGYR